MGCAVTNMGVHVVAGSCRTPRSYSVGYASSAPDPASGLRDSVLIPATGGLGTRECTLDAATTIFATDKDIKERQLVMFIILHRKLEVREDAVEVFFECQYLIPFDDDEDVVHIQRPAIQSVVSEDKSFQPLQDHLRYESQDR
ncbi:unnamed protein product [Schistocephalus solidus]|uniref:Uncharacterized protein n=1 Tax=Schistocephalus solidus TaxID=70667 RepID=A0A183T623_SCHSO|nr:unnamed protein product [Schistocephalus solidus]